MIHRAHAINVHNSRILIINILYMCTYNTHIQWAIAVRLVLLYICAGQIFYYFSEARQKRLLHLDRLVVFAVRILPFV